MFVRWKDRWGAMNKEDDGVFDGSRFLDLSAIREMPARGLEEPTNKTVTAVLDHRRGTDN